MNELMIPTTVGNSIVSGNTTFLAEAQKATPKATIYGNIAASLDGRMDRAAEEIGGYFARDRAFQLSRKYQEDSSVFEKYVMDNPIRLAQYEQQRQFETELISAAVQGTVKILAQGAQNILRWMEKETVKKYIWKQCAMYAEQITGGHPEKEEYRMLARHMEMISRQLFNKSEDIESAHSIKIKPVTLDAAQAMQLGMVLYQLYSAKHLWKKYSKEQCEMDEYDLFLMWAQLGLNGTECMELFKKCEEHEKTGSFPYAGVNYFMQCMFSNLSISLPNINHGVAEQINDQFLYYVPNGHTQQMAQRATKFIGKAAIGAGVAVFGIATENPALIASGVGEVLSLISVNDSDRAIAAEKCLLESGIPQSQAEQLVHDSMKDPLKNNRILLV